MNKKYIVELTVDERSTLLEVVKKLKGTSQCTGSKSRTCSNDRTFFSALLFSVFRFPNLAQSRKGRTEKNGAGKREYSRAAPSIPTAESRE